MKPVLKVHCEECGKAVFTRSKATKFCSSACTMRSYRKSRDYQQKQLEAQYLAQQEAEQLLSPSNTNQETNPTNETTATQEQAA